MAVSMLPPIRKSNKRIIIARVILLILLFSNLCFIWVNSSKVSKESDKTSKSIAQTVAKKVVKNFENMPKFQQQKHVSKLNNKIRTLAHFTEFIPLGILWWVLAFTFFVTDKKRWYPPFAFFLIAVFLSAMCALGDEIHQIFVDGRSFEFKDIATDTLGSACGCLFCVAVCGVKNIFKRI